MSYHQQITLKHAVAIITPVPVELSKQSSGRNNNSGSA
jgi:hypothetical protein